MGKSDALPAWFPDGKWPTYEKRVEALRRATAHVMGNKGATGNTFSHAWGKSSERARVSRRKSRPKPGRYRCQRCCHRTFLRQPPLLLPPHPTGMQTAALEHCHGMAWSNQRHSATQGLTQQEVSAYMVSCIPEAPFKPCCPCPLASHATSCQSSETKGLDVFMCLLHVGINIAAWHRLLLPTEVAAAGIRCGFLR